LVSRSRVAFCVQAVARNRCILRGILRLPESLKQSWLQKGRKFLSEKIAGCQENIAGIDRLAH